MKSSKIDSNFCDVHAVPENVKIKNEELYQNSS